MDKTYKITSNKVQLDVMYDRTVRQTKQLNDKVSNWQSRSGGSLDYNFVPDGRGTTNIWGGYGHLQEDLNACITITTTKYTIETMLVTLLEVFRADK